MIRCAFCNREIGVEWFRRGRFIFCSESCCDDWVAGGNEVIE